MAFEERFYREWASDTGLVSFNVTVMETDLQIFATSDLRNLAQKSIEKYRGEIEIYIKNFPSFKSALKPIEKIPSTNVPEIIERMISESEKASVGPMATVAGALSEFVGKDLLHFTDEIIVENGGDIFIKSKKKRIVGVYAGRNSSFSNKIGIEINPDQTPFGICTSSGTVGHSLSFGNSDAVIVISKSTILADGVATMLGNHLKDPDQIEKVLQLGMSINGILGVILIIDNKIGVLGDIKLVKI